MLFEVPAPAVTLSRRQSQQPNTYWVLDLRGFQRLSTSI